MRRVFVIDDEPDVVDLLETILRLEGFEVTSFTNGAGALTALLADPPELVILDLMMPDLDGLELLKLLRLDSRGARIPVLILSARTGAEDQLESLQRGANAYLCKPFSPETLVAEIGELLGRAGSGDG